MSFVSVELGDFGADTDDLFLAAYDSFNNLLGADIFPGSTSDTLVNLSVSFANISYVLFGSTNPQFLNSVFADNLTFTADSTPAIPLPAGGLLLLSGMAGLAFVRRRRT